MMHKSPILAVLMVPNLLISLMSSSALAHAPVVPSPHAWPWWSHRSRAHVIMQQDPPPPELDERQAQFMRSRGFSWNAKSRTWVQGNPGRAKRLEARSGARVLRVDVHADEGGISDEKRRVFSAALERFEAALRAAREEALGDSEEDRRLRLQLKDRIAKGYAPFVWLGVQLLCTAYLCSAAEIVFDPPHLLIPCAIGVAFAPLLSFLRIERWRRQPGVEDGDGALERLLVDAQLGSYALPGPWEWRASEPMRWGAAAFATESIASVNMALWWHATVEQAVVASVSPALGDVAAATLGVAAVSAAAAGRTAFFYDSTRDGLPGELDAAARMKASAQTYYSMTAPNAAEANQSVASMSALADVWTSKFGAVKEGDDEARTAQLALAVAHTAACALAWELSGRSPVAPVLALAASSLDVYVLRPDTERSRATLDLRSLSL